MYELKINLTPKKILDYDFKIDAKGYRPQEVDALLDIVISDYTEFIRFIKKIDRDKQDLLDENNRLKNELRKIRMEMEVTQEFDSGKFTSNNVDVLKRISNLEKIVYGKSEE